MSQDTTLQRQLKPWLLKQIDFKNSFCILATTVAVAELGAPALKEILTTRTTPEKLPKLAFSRAQLPIQAIAEPATEFCNSHCTF